MKYCPYCGAALMRGAISFCTECGRSIEETSDGTPEPFRIPDPHEETEERREVIWNLPETKNAPGESRMTAITMTLYPKTVWCISSRNWISLLHLKSG